ncbi:MAG: hypothetical protein ACRC6T_11925 [Sarcina sp.]
MKKLVCMGLIGVTALSFIACGGKGKEREAVNRSIAVEENIDTEISQEDENLEFDNTEIGENLEETDIEKQNNKLEEDKKSEVNEDKTERVFEITTMDIDYNIVSDGEVKTVGYGVAENISEILSVVSDKCFDGKSISLIAIETVGDKKVAVVDLKGEDSYWNQRMQGSLGASITEHNLIKNILQEDYEGYWVDGVRFTINGKSVEDTGHIPNLARTTYRGN